MLEDLALQVRSVVYLQGGRWKAAKKRGPWTEAVRRSAKDRKGREMPCLVVEVEKDGPPYSSSKNGPLSLRSWAQVENQVAAAASGKKYKSEPLFIDSGPYCPVYYRSSHKSSKGCNFKEDNHFVDARNQKHEACSGMEGDHRR